MTNARRWKPFLAFLTMIAVLATSVAAFALDRAADGYFHTGSSMRQKRFIVMVDVYAIGHMMKELPAEATIAGVIAAKTEKVFVLTMQRDVAGSKMTDAIGEAFKANGYTDAGRIAKFSGVFGEEVKKGQSIRIAYSPATDTTTASTNGKSVTVDGEAFMKAMWACFLKNPEQPSMGADLVSKMK
ncbi:MAG: chalcone isomerase family protein [Polyangiaceae bacterium]